MGFTPVGMAEPEGAIRHFCARRGEDDSTRISFEEAQKTRSTDVERVIDQLLGETRQTCTCKYAEVNFEVLHRRWISRAVRTIDCDTK